MLQEIREKTQGWIAGTIISIIIISFALWGIHSYFVGSGVSTTVATVNGVDISKEQLTVAYDRLRRQVQAQYGSAVTPKDEPTLKERALRSLVDIEILKQASLSQGFLISDQQVDDYLQSMPDFQVNGQFSLDRFQEVLSATLLTTSEFLDLIKTNLQIEQPRLGIMLSAFGLPEESRYTASLVNQVRDISYLSLPISQFLSSPIVITPAQMQAYYDAHQRDYKTPEEVSIDYLELSLSDLYSRFNPTETMLKSFYNENVNAYTQPMRWQLAGILVAHDGASADTSDEQAKILSIKQALDANPASFDKLVKQNSKANLPTGLVSINQLPADIQKAVMGLTQANQISDPVETAQGLVVIKALAVQEPKINSYDTVKAKVREAYIHQHAEDKFAELRDQLADLTYEHPDSLSVAAKALNLTVKNSALFSRDKAGSDITQFKKVRDAAFSNDVLNLQTNSDVISLNPETVVVLRVKSHLPSSLLPLKDVAQQITGKLKAQEAEDRADKFANTLLANFQSGADNTKLISQYQLHWIKVGVMGRYATKVDSAVLDSAFRLPRPEKGKVSYGVTRVPSGYAIVSVSGVQDGVLATPKQAAVFTEQVQNSLGYLEYSLYRESAVQHAKVKFSS